PLAVVPTLTPATLEKVAGRTVRMREAQRVQAADSLGELHGHPKQAVESSAMAPTVGAGAPHLGTHGEGDSVRFARIQCEPEMTALEFSGPPSLNEAQAAGERPIS